jgi:ABC-2 type transport system permease protein
MLAVLKRELRSYFTGLTGYVFIAAILLFGGIFTNIVVLKNYYPNFEYVLTNMAVVYVIAVPILTMRSMAEERRNNTDKLLYSLPVSMMRVVIAKYLAMLVVLLVPVAILALYPITLSFYGTIYVKSALSTLVGFYCLGAALLALGLFLSSLTDNQMVAAMLSLAAVLALYLLSQIIGKISASAAASYGALAILAALVSVIAWLLTRSIPMTATVAVVLEAFALIVYLVAPDALENTLPTVVRQLSVFERFSVFSGGAFDLTAILYDLSLSAVFVCFTGLTLEKGRWS